MLKNRKLSITQCQRDLPGRGVVVSHGCRNKAPPTGGLTQTSSLAVWRLEAWDKGGKGYIPPEALGKDPPCLFQFLVAPRGIVSVCLFLEGCWSYWTLGPLCSSTTSS